MEINRFADMGIGIPSNGLQEFYGDGSDGVLDLNTYYKTLPPITLTTINGGVVDALFDGNVGTYYSNTLTKNTSADIALFDLGKNFPLASISITNAYASTSNTIKLYIYTSFDNIKWTLAYASAFIGLSGSKSNFTVTSNELGARYTKLVVKNESGSYDSSFNIGEITFNANLTGTILIPVDGDDIVIKQCESINIPAGYTLTTNKACRGIILYSKGDVVINGTIDMSYKGGGSPVELPFLWLGSSNKKAKAINDEVQALNGGKGGNGGNAYGNVWRYGGIGNIRKFLGGLGAGGAGGATSNIYGSNGGSVVSPYMISTITNMAGQQRCPSGTTLSDGIKGVDGVGTQGGSGGGIAHDDNSYIVPGNGGYGLGAGGGGGGGANLTGTSYGDTAYAGHGGNGNSAGGFVLIIAKGSIAIGSLGYIKASGSNGGNAGNGNAGSANQQIAYGGGGGGGAGGGVIALLYKVGFSNSGNVIVSGGAGGYYGALAGITGTQYIATNGTAGSVGTIYTRKID